MHPTPPTPYEIEFLIPRLTPDEHHHAMVHATVADESFCTIRTFVDALTLALSRWAHRTDEGRTAWTRSSHDFNVGDLSTELPNPALERELFNVGITNLRIELSGSLDANPDHWHYDTVLIDPELEHHPIDSVE